MVLQDYEVDGDNIIINKAELESYRNHYFELARHHKSNKDAFRQALYMGKHSVMCDLLKLFEPLE